MLCGVRSHGQAAPRSIVGGAALVLMMGLTVADVVLRNLFAIVVPGGLEMTGLLMILVALSTLAMVEIARSHIQVDLLLRRCPTRSGFRQSRAGLQITFATMVVSACRCPSRRSI